MLTVFTIKKGPVEFKNVKSVFFVTILQGHKSHQKI